MVSAEYLKMIRQQSIMSQEDFAKEIGVSFSTVNRWETGKSSPNYKTIKKIKDYCDRQGIKFEISNDTGRNN